MKEQTAISRLRYHFMVHDDGRPTPYLDEAVSMAIQTLEKQIPKKPSEVYEKSAEDYYYLSFMCPSCNTSVIGQPYRPNYCKHCGQKLDWSEV